jgi:hypothetical protein
MARRAPSASEESIAKETQRRPAAPRDLVWQMGPAFEVRGSRLQLVDARAGGRVLDSIAVSTAAVSHEEQLWRSEGR